mgnify:CR=1 FL=1
MHQLQDESPMPFCKYKDVRMEDVPASYLHWLWCNGLEYDKQSSVADYIRRFKPVLQLETPNLIW